jgi:Tfp pilus assembly protein PilN
MMAKKTVNLYIDDSSVRLLVVQGRRIKKWADTPLAPGMVRNGIIVDEAEVADKIKLVFKALELRPGKVTVGISGLNCLSRPLTFPQLPDDMLEEAVRREAKAALPVPLEQLYLSWHPMPAPPGKSQVFIVAIPRDIADALQKTLTRAGLKPNLLELKPLALARATREATAIVVDVQPAEFDIVIISDGVPQPVRTLPMPGKAPSMPEKLAMIKADLNRTIEFYNTNNPDNLLFPTAPVLISGVLTSQPELWPDLSAELGRPVLPISPPLECPAAGLDPDYYLPAMGLALKEMPPSEAGPLATNLNALPAPYQPKPVSLTNVLGIPLAVVALGVLIFLALLIQTTAADLSSIQRKLDTTDQLLQQKLSQRQELNGRIAGLEQNIVDAEAAGGNFAAALKSLETQSALIDPIATTVNSLPASANLTSLNFDNGIFTLDGRSPTEVELLSYLKVLDDSGHFSGITITSLTKAGDELMDFTLVLETGD